jgi:putative flippase GtrA
MIAKLFRFGVAGGATTALVYVVFLLLLRSGVHYLAASAAAWAVGLCASFVLNRGFTFQVRRRVEIAEGVLFVTGYVLQLLLGLGVYGVLIGRLGIDPTVSFVINTAISAAFSFAFMNMAVFRQASARVRLS